MKKECFGTDKVLGDLSAELPTPHPDCVKCSVNTNCYYKYGQLSKQQEVSRIIKESGTWQGPI